MSIASINMRKSIYYIYSFIILFSILCSSKINAQTVNWGLNIGGTGFDFARFTIVDDSNNFYVLGMFNNSVTIDSAGNPKVMVSAGQRDYFLIKYNCNRVQQWRVRVGGTGQEGGAFAGYGLALSKSGNIFISGSFSGTCNFVSSNGNVFSSKTSSGADDIFTAKLNNNGIFQWVIDHGSSGWDEAGSIAVDDNENVYTLGFFSGTCTFKSVGAGPTLNRVSFGSTDVFITKHNSNGSLIYATAGGSTAQDMATNARADKYGNLYVTGIFSCCSGGNGTFGNYTIGNANSWGGFVAKLNSAGQYVWIKHMGSAADEAFINLEIDHKNDKIYAVGHFNATTTITSTPPLSAVTLTPNGGSDILLTKFDSSGGLLWANKYGGTGNDIGWGIDIGNDGNPIIGGEFANTFTFGSTNLTATGGMNAMAGKVNANNGIPMTAGRVSGNGLTYCRGLSHNKSGNVVLTGYFTQTTNAGASVLNSAGAEDAFIASYQFTDTTIIAANATVLNCGDSIRIYATNKTEDKFRWFRNDTLVLVTDSNFYYAKRGGTYFVVNTNNCAVPDSSNKITLTGVGFISNVVSNLNACKGDSVQLSFSSNGSSFAWSPANLFSNPNILNPKFRADTSRYLYLVASTGVCQKRDSFFVTINQVNLSIAPISSICLGDSIRLVASGANSYAWSPKLYINDTTLSNPFVKPTANQYFKVKGITNSCSRIDSILVVVNSALAIADPDTAICLGDTLQMLSVVNNLNIRWTPNYNINSDTSQFPKIWPRADTSYILRVTNNGCIARDTIRIRVKPLPNVIASADTSICAGDTINISASGAITYLWSPNLNLAGATLANPKVFPTISQTYRVVGSNNGCSAIDSLRVSVTQISVNLPTDTLLCSGDTIQLTSSYIGSNIAWSPAYNISNTTLSSPRVWPKQDTTYYLQVINGTCAARDSIRVKIVNVPNVDAGSNLDICQGSTVNLLASGANTYHWWPNLNINDTTLRNPIVSTPISRTYYVLGKVGNCAAIDSIAINFIPVASNAGNDTLICPGDTISLRGAGTPSLGNWIPNWNMSDPSVLNPKVWPSKDTAYVLSISNSGCRANDTVRIRLRPLPLLNAGSNQTICIGDSITLNASGALIYQWLNNYNISDVNIANPKVYPMVDTSYVLRGLIDFCPTTDTVQITVLEYPIVDAGPDQTICHYETTDLAGQVSQATSFMWRSDPSLNDAAILNPTVYPKQNTTSYVLNANNQTCVSRDTVTIFVAPLLNAAISANPKKGDVPLNVVFTNQSSATGKYFVWELGDGSRINTKDVLHTFNQSGKFSVLMIVEDSIGCVDSATVEIEALELEDLEMPNVFTPQGDGINETFGPVYIGNFEYLKLYIYSRWGELLYETYIPGGTWWDGTYKDAPCPDGVYFYILEAKSKAGNFYERHGTVTLLR